MDLSKKQAFIMVGYPGSGKSTLAKKLADKFQCEYLSSDKFRQLISKQTRYDNVGDDVVNKSRGKAYKLMYQTAAELLEKGHKVIVDATHLEHDKRKPVLDNLLLATKPSAICFVTVETPYHIINQRMKAFENDQNQNSSGTNGETVYEAWKRVYGYFEERKSQGIISWPDPQEGIDVFSYEKVYTLLD